MALEKDFSKRRNFPGVSGNPFDIFLHQLNKIENIPNFLFGILLLCIAFLVTWGNFSLGIILFGFICTDWFLLALLPKIGKSYGPPKPPVLMMACARCIFALLPSPINYVIEGCGTVLAIYGYYVEPFSLNVISQKLTTNKLNKLTKLRILHLGDLHIERITKRELELNRLIKQLNPDIILFSGDILNLSYIDDPKSIIDAREIIQQWKADLGVYIVSGSPAVDTKEVFLEVIKELPVYWLNDNIYSIKLINGQHVDIYGISCTHRPHWDKKVLDGLVRKKSDNYSILLYHSPDLAPAAAEIGMDLQLSGHTHGGQICLPIYGALFTGSLYGKKFEVGEKKIRDMILSVTRGIGMEGGGAPRVRFLCPPEIHLIELSGL